MIDSKKIMQVSVIFVLAFVSIFGVSKYTSEPSHYQKTIKSLEEKKITVAQLTAASTGAAAAITLLPGDAGTPIADKLADLSGYFVIILAAIYLEKVLTTVTGHLAFTYIIPFACFILILGILLKRDQWKQAAYRIIAFALVLFMLIPASVSISNLIEKTHGYSVQQTIEDANAASQELEENSDEEDENAFDQFVNKVKNGVTGELEKFEALLSSFIDSIAMLIVTTCVIPIGVLLVMIMVIKQFFAAGPANSFREKEQQ